MTPSPQAQSAKKEEESWTRWWGSWCLPEEWQQLWASRCWRGLLQWGVQWDQLQLRVCTDGGDHEGPGQQRWAWAVLLGGAEHVSDDTLLGWLLNSVSVAVIIDCTYSMSTLLCYDRHITANLFSWVEFPRFEMWLPLTASYISRAFVTA